MILHYYKSQSNFGDMLNPWLWPQLLPGRFASEDDTVFLGIGTILQESVPPASRYIVLGAGGGYGPFPKIDNRWQIYAVRGPLTARALGLPAEVAVTDGAYLLGQAPLPQPRGGRSVGFMPHWRSMRRVPWRGICESSGVRFINPFESVDTVLAELRGCDCLITEAMHGAIVADLFRIPWIPVRLGAHFLDFKWRDWLASVEVACEAIPLTAMDPWSEHQEGDGPGRKALRRAVNGVSYYLRGAKLIAELRNLRLGIERKRRPVSLSSDRILTSRISALEKRLDALRNAVPESTGIAV